MTGSKTKHPLYACWCSMKDRCLNKKNISYRNYGGRGITVCLQWQLSFLTFARDMGLRPTSKHSIDRIDNDGNYEPGNCRWATRREQSSNRRDSVLLTYDGRTMPLAHWAREIKITPESLNHRIALGWTDEQVLTTPTSYLREQIEKLRSLGGDARRHHALGHYPHGWENDPHQRKRLGIEEPLTPNEAFRRAVDRIGK